MRRGDVRTNEKGYIEIYNGYRWVQSLYLALALLEQMTVREVDARDLNNGY